MSGLKYSKIQLEAERKASQEALGRINTLQGSIEGIKEKVQAILSKIPAGVKESFSQDIQKVRDWQSKKIPAYSKDMNSTQLNYVVNEAHKINESGKEVIDLLIELKEVKREKKARELIGRLERLRANIHGTQILLNKWRPHEYKTMVNDLDELSSLIDREEFVEAERRLNQSEAILTQLRQETTLLEDQDNQRHYVLKALKDVCKEMGWKDAKEPALQNSNEPGSPLIYEVDTYYAGNITFYLALEEIKVNSPISSKNDICYKEFDKLSEKLKKFGITTEFESIEAPRKKPVMKTDRRRGLPGRKTITR